MSLSYNNVLPAALDKNYMVFLNWRWNFHSADIFKLVKGNLKTKFPRIRAPLHISSNTNKQFRKTI